MMKKMKKMKKMRKMSKRVSFTKAKAGRHTIYLVWMLWLIPHQLLAIPQSIAKIVATLAGENKKKSPKVTKKTKNAMGPSVPDTPESGLLPVDASPILSQDQPTLSNAQKARLEIDKAIQDRKLSQHPATWYYRGVIYDQLLRESIPSSQETPALLHEALEAYHQVKKLHLFNKQFYNFSLINIAALWSFYLQKGISYYQQESFEQAIAHFMICRRILPDEPTPLYYMAITYHTHAQPKEALDHYQAYLHIKGPQVAIARAMADIYYNQLQQFDTAIALLDTALIAFPCNSELLEEKLIIYKNANRIEEYTRSLTESIDSFNPTKEVGPCYAYAYLLADQGRIEEAITYYSQILKHLPTHYPTFCQLGCLFYNEAIKTYDHLRNLNKQARQWAQDCQLALHGWVYISVQRPFSDCLGWSLHDLCLQASHGGTSTQYYRKHSFFSSALFKIYNGPLYQPGEVYDSHICGKLQGSNLSPTSVLYSAMNRKIAFELLCNNLDHQRGRLKKYLQKSAYYLPIAYRQDKANKSIAQALYFTLFHLNKNASAHRLLQAICRQFGTAGDDPFVVDQ